MASSVEQLLARVNEAGTDVQSFANALADKIRQGGDIAVRTSNATTGAAVGAKTGSTVPTQTPTWFKYGIPALAAWYFFLRRR